MSAREHEGLLDALAVLRARIAGVRLALDTLSADDGRRERVEVLDQLDDYLLPRLRSATAPLLAVVGGSTGAGKSTLVNSLLGEQVTSAGVLRPTTRWPVLVHHPLDARWFTTDRVLPGLARLTGPAAALTSGPGAAVSSGPGVAIGDAGAGLRLVASEALPPGLALLDAPDVDSVVEENRTLATQLLGAADLWLFVTTAARYADAVPWDLLAAAARRRVQLALVLDRVDAQAEDAVGAHLRRMLDDRGLAEAALLRVPEIDPVGGLLPERAVGQVADWLTAIGGDPSRRAAAISATREGVTDDVLRRARAIAAAADDQRDADRRLRAMVEAAYDDAAAQVQRSTSDGTLLRGEVLARWQDVVGTGDLVRAVEQKVSWLRDRVVAAVKGRGTPEPALAHAIGHSLEAVVLDAAQDAADRAYTAWRNDPAGAGLLDGLALSRASGGLRAEVAEQIRGWQADVLGLVQQEGAGKRSAARAISFGVNGLGAAAMVAVFASTGGLTGAEVGIAGGSALLAQRLLEAVFGDEAVRQLTRRAHEQLAERVCGVLAGESARYTAQLDAWGTDSEDGDAVRGAVLVAERERAESRVQARAESVNEPVGGAVPSGRGNLRGAGLQDPGGGTRRSAAWARGGGADRRERDERKERERAQGEADVEPPGIAHRLRGWWRRVTRPDDGAGE